MERISIATTTFNDAKTIVPVLNQLMNQSFLPDEIVIADGGSKDNTVDVVRQYAETCPVKITIISDGVRRNIPKGFNDAIKATRNNWVLVMGTGNSYEPNFLENMVKAKSESDARVLYCTIIGQNTTKFGYIFNQYFLRGNKIQDLDISNHGMLIDKTVFDEIGYFWEGFVYAGEDLEFSRRIHKKEIKSLWVEDAIAYWDTPQVWKDYQKKMKVNSIADWQMEEASVILNRCWKQAVMLLAYLTLIVWKPVALMLLFPLVVLVGYKKKTSCVPSILLGLYNRYLMIWFYIQNKKYCDKEYHIPKEYS